MEIIFDREDLKEFDLTELRKMMQVQVNSERFEGAALIRDVIEDRKRGYGLLPDDSGDDEAEEIQ